MEELYKDINKWIKECENEEIGQLADILVEGFLHTLKKPDEELKVESEKKDKKTQSLSTLYY